MNCNVSKRRVYVNRINAQIKELLGYVEQNNNAIERFRISKSNLEYSRTQINKRKKIVEEHLNTIDELYQRIEQINSGLIDDEINKKTEEDTKLIKSKHNDAMQKLKRKKEEKESKKSESISYMKNIINEARQHKSKKWEYKSTYRHYCKTVSKLPDYMKKKLDKMPCNKGYIWRGCYFYGKLPEEKLVGKKAINTIMFEKRKGGLLIIHECDDNENRIYEKVGRERRKLISTTKRKKIDMSNTLLNYIKV